jgi:hypothetical protein
MNEKLAQFLERVQTTPINHWKPATTDELVSIAAEIDAHPTKALWYANLLLMSVAVRNHQLDAATVKAAAQQKRIDELERVNANYGKFMVAMCKEHGLQETLAIAQQATETE